MSKEQLSVAVIGAGMAGRSHANGYREANTIHGAGLPPIRLAAIADVNVKLAKEVADRYGFEDAAGSWEEAANDPSIDAVSIVVGNSLHREIAEAMLAAGKHVLCEKPPSNSIEDAEAMVKIASQSNLVASTAYSFRRNPAIEAIRDLIADGSLVNPVLVDARYLADYATDPKGPMGWRFRGEMGTGALSDLGAHIIDLAEYVCGPIVSVSGAQLTTTITERHLPIGNVIGHDMAELSEETEPVTNDDTAIFTATFDNGAVATIRTSRVAFGLPNDLVLTVTGTECRAEFDWKRPAEFVVSDMQPDARTRGDRVVYVAPNTSRVFDDAVPMPGGNISFGYGDLFTYEIRVFIDEILEHPSALPRNADLTDGLHTMKIVEAIKKSHEQGGATVKV
ncbi:Gfo/Idh/MocA family protein [Flaviflexus massiliensis]|uniref:Gfo/Idh/MocA family protein n=1 Tax=Flaviflexus massiliensis TaxID=1522309 RepID=UPI0006D56B45|nr:Gfo/Idh/MocA family oxidoreductase [Flaviflexus massiliensis]